MNPKKLKLIESGMMLFSEKGYHATSIETIATEAGMSKGAFYLHFHSKKDFVMTALHLYYQEISNRIQHVQEENLTPSDSLAKQIDVVTQFIYKYKEVLTMYLRENSVMGTQTDTLIQQMKLAHFNWLQQNIQQIYGTEMAGFYPDLVIQLEGLMNGYFKWIIIDGIAIDRHYLGTYLVRRIDDMVKGMLERGEAPLVTMNHVEEWSRGVSDVTSVLTAMQAKIDTLNLTSEKAEQLHDALNMLFEAIEKDESQAPLIQGLLVHFQRIPAFVPDCHEIARQLHIDLLD
ncbi:TetR/AcrR family transcriptional regulator [Barrientosiimonas marina]|uniref:TetR/AcrR family transcriptional regulator n=1 Tax=Lentibacillus kimchii TaxID=1542911 RepID=A0ABW2UUW6_9BACI